MRCSTCLHPDSTNVCGRCQLRVYCGNACARLDYITHDAEEHCPDGANVADRVLEHVWIGGIEALSDAALMSHVGAVVSAIVPRDKDELVLLRDKVGTRAHYMVPVWDDPQARIEAHWPGAAAFIDGHVRAGRDVLVHCHAGISRSVSTVIYYMMTKLEGEYASPEAALEHIRKARCIAGPNEGFMEKLRAV